MKLRIGIVSAMVTLVVHFCGVPAAIAVQDTGTVTSPSQRAALEKHIQLELNEAMLVEVGGQAVALSNPRVRLGARPGGGILSVKAKLELQNVGTQPIRQVYVSFTGSIHSEVKQLLSAGQVIAPRKIVTVEPSFFYLADVQGNDRIEAELVAVVLEDNAVVGSATSVDAYRAAKNSRVLPQQPEISSFDGNILDPSALQIVSARYGVGEFWADVTPLLNDIASTSIGPITVPVRTTSLQCDDPAEDELKSLEVTVEVSGVRTVVTVPEKALFSFGFPGAIEGFVGASGDSFKVGDWEVFAAWYGADASWVDVLPRLRLQVRDDKVDFQNVGELANTDPAQGAAKQLNIYYRMKGKSYLATYGDERRVVLPDSAAVQMASLQEIPRPPHMVVKTGGPDSVHPVAEALLGPGDYEILNAKYGFEETFVDVTDKVRQMLSSPANVKALEITTSPFRVMDVDVIMLGDRRVLTLSVKSGGVRGGVTHEVVVKDFGFMLLGSPGQVEGQIGSVFEPLIIGDMRIVAAWYGIGTHWCDALPELHKQLEDGVIEARTRSLSAFDPAPNLPKTLRVYFEREGSVHVAVFAELETVNLPLTR